MQEDFSLLQVCNMVWKEGKLRAQETVWDVRVFPMVPTNPSDIPIARSAHISRAKALQGAGLGSHFSLVQQL